MGQALQSLAQSALMYEISHGQGLRTPAPAAKPPAWQTYDGLVLWQTL